MRNSYRTRRERDQDQLEFRFETAEQERAGEEIADRLFCRIGDVMLTVTPKPPPEVYARLSALHAGHRGELRALAAGRKGP